MLPALPHLLDSGVCTLLTCSGVLAYTVNKGALGLGLQAGLRLRMGYGEMGCYLLPICSSQAHYYSSSTLGVRDSKEMDTIEQVQSWWEGRSWPLTVP